MSQYYYWVQAFEADVVKIWGKESNLKRRGGGKNQSSLKNIHPWKTDFIASFIEQ
jgi:hypothetical protein